MADAEFADLINVKVIGTWLCMKHQIARMREQRQGVIVNLGSVIDTGISRPGTTAYATSKAAVAAMTRSAAREHIADGIRINLVSPGSTDTSMSLLPGETVEGGPLGCARRCRSAESRAPTRSRTRCCGWLPTSRASRSGTT